ncbi:MAG: type IV pilus assembly protein PilQ, partial [Methylococcaceae bacterium NSP1-1]
QQETATVVEQLDPLVTEYIKINYARAENFKNMLNGLDTAQFGSCGIKSLSPTQPGPNAPAGNRPGNQPGNQSGNQPGNQSGSQSVQKNDVFRILSPRGSAVVDARTNTLIIRETTNRLEEAKKLIRKLDMPVSQVMIESRIVIASNTFAKELGVRFGVAGKGVNFGNSITTGNSLNRPPELSDPRAGLGTVSQTPGTVGSINGTAVINDALVDLAASNPYGALGMTLARGADYVLNLELSALQDQGRGEIVSNPRVMTTDRCNAKIKQGFEIPYQSSSANQGTNIEYKEALLELDVLPQITPNGSISMSLNITKDEPDNLNTVNGQPSLIKRQVETTVQVMDGETVVLGGVFEGTQINSTNSVPFFADIPIIGFLFKKTINTDDKKELLIFVTPKIIKDNAASN